MSNRLKQANDDAPQVNCAHLANWPDIVTPLINAINTEHFYKTLVESINRIAPIDSVIVMIFRPDEKPTLLYDGLHPSEITSFYDGYLAGAYLLSPLYRHYRTMRPGFYRMESLEAPMPISNEFGSAYYNDAGLCDEGNFLVNLDAETSALVCFGRQQLRMPFSDLELHQLHQAEPVFRAAIERSAQGMNVASQDAAVAKQVHQQLQGVMHLFGHSILTDREREVLELMFEGKASKSAAKVLHISPETERGHRKNIYAKLDVASQAELFSLLFTVMTEVELVTGEDPLISYRNR